MDIDCYNWDNYPLQVGWNRDNKKVNIEQKLACTSCCVDHRIEERQGKEKLKAIKHDEKKAVRDIVEFLSPLILLIALLILATVVK